MRNKLDLLPAMAVFAKIVQFGSMSRAAEHLEGSRSSVSKQLSTLENRLDVRLIQRTTRKLTLTDAGEQLLVEAISIAEAMDAVEARLDNIRGVPAGPLKVSCSVSIGRLHLVPLLKAFSSKYPSIEINLQLEDRFVDLVAEQVDVSIRIGHLPDSSLVARKLGELRWQICASPDYLERRGEPKEPKELVAHSCLYYRNNQSDMSHWSFFNEQGEYNVKVSGPLSINDGSALVEAAINGMGILTIDKLMLGDAVERGLLVPILANYRLPAGLPVYALYPQRKNLSNKTRIFVDFLLDKFSQKLSGIINKE